MILKVAGAMVGVIVLIPILIGSGVQGAISAVFGSSSSLDCTPTGDTSNGVAGYGREQLANAATIVAVGTKMSVPEHGLVTALAAAMQESTLINLGHGDRDSLGLFQQRPSQGWGTPAQIMNPTYAATKFFEHLLAVPGWQSMTVNDAAQAVQRSGTPNAYAKHEPAARAVLAAVLGANCTPSENALVGTGDCNAIQTPNRAAFAAINYACGQRGLPYVWGGDGPHEGGFDCSGLTKAAYGAAGITLPRTAHTQFHAGPRVPVGQPLLPGDLVFYGNPNTKIRHVGLYIGGGLMIDAPDRGQVVKIEPYRYPSDDYAGATRPVNRDLLH
ncbi:NlpC/P60 family protein [Kibdelosporangium philippinense]|uniref:NlpC/P60 family protein n=1 Tax=Kibdelosporangium philippinense TaxID=211113 RepID=A0ABS8ZUF6_9PSEU|nr:C40 family peptidase [Kibdelosporangium philippinense]MCE7010053.1 NlpC/P60 family protein [Kibdelosporangium philippinense]